jgi:gluconolactonase
MLPQAPPIVERLHTGFRYVEGAAVDRQGNLYFTDVPAHRIYRRSAQGKLTVLVRRSEGTVGLDVDRKGRLLGAQNRTGRLASFTPPRWSSRNVGSPNDLAADLSGGVYVTSPDFRGRKQDAIYYVTFTGAKIVDKKVRNPNGIALSPDGRTLYVVGYGTHDLTAFPVQGPGRLGPGRRLMKLAGPGGKQANTGGDGMSVGPDGTLYVAVPEAKGIHVANPQGRFLRFLAVPEKPSNCAVSSDGRFLFVTAQTSVYRVRL